VIPLQATERVLSFYIGRTVKGGVLGSAEGEVYTANTPGATGKVSRDCLD